MHALMVPNYNKILLAYVQFRKCNWQILCHCHAGLWGDQTRFERQRTTFRLFCVQIHANEFSTISFVKIKQRKSPTEIRRWLAQFASTTSGEHEEKAKTVPCLRHSERTQTAMVREGTQPGQRSRIYYMFHRIFRMLA